MAPSSIRTALLTSDPALREAVRQAMGGLVRLETEIDTRYSEFTETAVRGLQRAAPDVILLDLSQEPELGLRLAQSLAEGNPTLRFLAFGPAPSPEFLLEAMRAGVSEYLTAPYVKDTVSAALERICQKLGRGADQQQEPGQILAFFGAKGGAGVTTAAANFAILTHRLTSRSTLLLDLDPHLGEAALALGLEPRYTFIDVIQNFHRLDADLLESYTVRHHSG
jgi:pilus assembly protein CpaE